MRLHFKMGNRERRLFGWRWWLWHGSAWEAHPGGEIWRSRWIGPFGVFWKSSRYEVT